MTTAYTSLLGFALPVTGELNGTWGDVVNDSITQLVEDSVAGQATAAVTSGDWTLTTTGSGAANQARCAILIPTGTPGVSRNVIAPSSSKAYVVINQSDGAVVLKGSATTGVTIPAGKKMLCAWNGTDFVQIGESGTVTAVSVASANGFAGTSSGGATPALTLSTTITGVLKGNGTAISAASSGTDYAPATSGTSILYGNGAGGFSNVTIGSGVSFLGGTLSATGSGGTVTSVSGTSPVASSGGTTPAISLASGYGDTQNPYASKTQNYVLASPNGSSGVPTFRALVSSDIPALSYAPYPAGSGIPVVSGGSSWGTTVTAPSGTIVGTTDTQTLTNKWVQPRVLASTADSATPTLNTDSYDMMVITGQTTTITSFTTNLSGTPVNGQKLWIAITGTGAIGITWGASFESSTVTLPTTTVSTNRLDVGFVWNVATSKWRCVATA